MLMSQRARLNGPVFVIGWLIGLAVIGVVVLAVAGPGGASSDGKPATIGVKLIGDAIGGFSS
jgi:hypothetical protein